VLGWDPTPIETSVRDMAAAIAAPEAIAV